MAMGAPGSALPSQRRQLAGLQVQQAQGGRDEVVQERDAADPDAARRSYCSIRHRNFVIRAEPRRTGPTPNPRPWAASAPGEE
jgi:hypothetical protein